MNDKDEYKGIFYDDNSERKYYEGGAHFSYEELVTILINIQKQQIINENKNKSLNKKSEIDKDSILKQVPIVSRQKNFSMKNIFSCDNQIIKNKIQKINNNNNNYNNNNNNNKKINNNDNNNLKIKKLNFLRNNVSKEKSLSKKKSTSKKKNMNQSNSVIHLGSGQCLNININNNYNNNFININPNSNINNNFILNNNSNSNPLRFLKDIINENKSGKKKPQSRNSKSKGRNYKKKNNINSSIEFNHEYNYNYNYNYYLVEAGLDKSAKVSGNRHSGKSTGAQPSNSIHNLSINGLNNLTKYSQSNMGFFGLNCLDNSINNSKIFNKKNTSTNKNKIMDSENQMNGKDNGYIFLDNYINVNNKDINNKNTKNQGALSHEKNNGKKNFNSFINKKILINNFVNNNNNNEVKQGVLGPIILNEKNIKKLKNFNMTIFNLSTSKNKNSSSKDKKINFNLNNKKNNNININGNNNIFNNNNNNNNSNRNILKFTNQSLLKSICLQKQNSRNIFNCSIKNKNKNMEKNIPEKLAEKSCNVVGKLMEQQNNISRNSKINYDKLIKSFEG